MTKYNKNKNNTINSKKNNIIVFFKYVCHSYSI